MRISFNGDEVTESLETSWVRDETKKFNIPNLPQFVPDPNVKFIYVHAPYQLNNIPWKVKRRLKRIKFDVLLIPKWTNFGEALYKLGDKQGWRMMEYAPNPNQIEQLEQMCHHATVMSGSYDSMTKVRKILKQHKMYDKMVW